MRLVTQRPRARVECDSAGNETLEGMDGAMLREDSRTKVVLVTGATSGIGRAAAELLAARGHRVVATGRRPEILRRLAAQGHETLTLDVTDPHSIAAAREEIELRTEGRGLDVLVNCAGVSSPGPLEFVSDDELRRQFDVNVFGLMAMTRAFVPTMRERGSGLVVNVGSPRGRGTLPLDGPYGASKSALRTLTSALRAELAPFGVRVAIVEPGMAHTGLADSALANLAGHRGGGPYAVAVARAREAHDQAYRTAPGPEAAAHAIARAVESRRARSRYGALTARLSAALAERLPGCPQKAAERQGVRYAPPAPAGGAGA